MSNKILVTYATTYGSTQEVADKVAKTLAESGIECDLMGVNDVRSLSQYRAVVLGAPLYMFHLHKDALRFLSDNKASLAGVPVAVFALGPAGRPDAKDEWAEARSELDRELAKLAWLKPVDAQLFGGKLDPAKLRFPHSLIAKVPGSPLRGAPAVDLRDWQAIRSWAVGLAGKL